MPRRAARTDSNHQVIRDYLRTIPGVTVFDASAVGGGFPDLVVGIKGRNIFIEIKDGSKPPSRQKLTRAERDFQGRWMGQYAVVRNIDEAHDVVMFADMPKGKSDGHPQA